MPREHQPPLATQATRSHTHTPLFREFPVWAPLPQTPTIVSSCVCEPPTLAPLGNVAATLCITTGVSSGTARVMARGGRGSQRRPGALRAPPGDPPRATTLAVPLVSAIRQRGTSSVAPSPATRLAWQVAEMSRGFSNGGRRDGGQAHPGKNTKQNTTNAKTSETNTKNIQQTNKYTQTNKEKMIDRMYSTNFQRLQ